MPTRILLFLLLVSSQFPVSTACAQGGDAKGEIQKSLVPKELIPPAPVLSPTDALKSFKLAPGFRIELVAAEPLVHDPVAVTWDADGRLWVLEMRGFMPNPDGVGEFEKVGSVAVLEDTDGDGRMDKRTVFADGLVMPRAMALVGNGLLVAEPPNLWYYSGASGDIKAGERVLVARDYATQADPKFGLKANPEHSSNGLMRDMDNWIYSANHTTRFRQVDGEWKREPTAFRGQWGLSQDNFGRLVYNSNSDNLRIDLVPSAYLNRNPFYRGAKGLNVDPIHDLKTYPIRVNPGVNRGYQPKQLRDGKLATFTAACGPSIYRGDNFPAEFQGNAFVCEPAGNLIKRDILTDEGVSVTGRQAYENSEFLASTDERFRPVNSYTGPDGGLYIVDLYRGIIQHRIYLTTYLRNQALDRNLQTPVGLGRIYRVVHEGKRPGPKPTLSKATAGELVSALSHPNGWWRDTAQRLLIERAPAAAVPLLKKLVTSGTNTNALARLHALWTLEGMNQLDAATLTTVLKSEQHSKIRATAIRLCEPLLKTGAKAELLPRLLTQLSVAHPDIQLQLAFTLGEVNDPKAAEGLAQIARNRADNELIRDAVITGLGLREIEFIEMVLKDSGWGEKQPGRQQILTALARCVTLHSRAERVGRLLDLAARATGWRQMAILDGMVPAAPVYARGQTGIRPKKVHLPSEPRSLAVLTKSPDAALRQRIEKISANMTWPNKPGAEPEPVVRALTAGEQTRFEQGKALYEISCASCHQLHGFGYEGLAPPLVDSEWLTNEQRLMRIVLNGLHGPIRVQGQKFDLDMPGLGTFDDEQLAAILTYIRREWDHTMDPIEPSSVKKVREETAQRQDSWTEEELLKIR